MLISAEASGSQPLLSCGLVVGQVCQGETLPVRNFKKDRLLLARRPLDGRDFVGREVGALLEPAADAGRFRNPGAAQPEQ